MPQEDPDHHTSRPEALFWGWAWLLINAAVLISIAALIPVFQRMSRNLGLPQSRNVIFYAVAAIAMGNAIRRIILQWQKLKRLHGDGS